MKQKVLFIIPSLSGGGAEKVLVNILSSLSRDKIEATLLLFYNEGVNLKNLPSDIEKIALFKSSQGFWHKIMDKINSFRNFVYKKRGEKFLKGKHFDTIVSFLEGDTVKLHYQLMSKGNMHCSWVHCNQETFRWYGRHLSKFDETKIYQRMDKIALVSVGVKESFERLFQTQAKKHVIPNPIVVNKNYNNLELFKNGKFTIISSGRLIAIKRFDRLIKVASILKQKGYDFIIQILGDGPLMDELKSKAQELEVTDRIEFLGYKEDPYAYMKASNVFCLTSESEGYPMVVGESLCLGVPVIAPPLNGITEMLAQGGGIITDSDPKNIADELEKLMVNPIYLQKLAKETELAAENLEITRSIKTIEDFLLSKTNGI